MHEYNSQLEDLSLKEYGRNVQKITKHIAKIEDEEKRTRMANTLVGLMKQINPNSKDNQDYDQMVWDHMFMISELELEVKDAPYAKPTTTIQGPPQKVDYSTGEIRFLHYGRNIELLIQQAITITDPEEKEAAVIAIAKMMKRFYITWNKDNVDAEVIINHIGILSKKALTLDINKVNEQNLLQLPRDAKGGPTNQPYSAGTNSHRGNRRHSSNGRQKSNGRNNTNNRRRNN